MNSESKHFVSRHSGFMMLAELLQAGNPLLQNNPISVPLQSHPDEILQRPIPSLASNSNESQASTSQSSSGIAVAEPNHPDEFQIRNRGNRVNEFLELLSRISNRSPGGSNEDEPGNNSDQQENQGIRTTDNSNPNDNDSSDNSDDEREQNQGRCFSYFESRSMRMA